MKKNYDALQFDLIIFGFKCVLDESVPRLVDELPPEPDEFWN